MVVAHADHTEHQRSVVGSRHVDDRGGRTEQRRHARRAGLGRSASPISFQSATARTAGFNTVDIGAMQPSTWLVRRDSSVTIQGRNIPVGLQREALALVIAALGTVGLTTGITDALGAMSRLVIVALMPIGRVGPITFGTAILLRPEARALATTTPRSRSWSLARPIRKCVGRDACFPRCRSARDRRRPPAGERFRRDPARCPPG